MERESQAVRRCVVRFVGHVQGVGFRQTSAHAARSHDVTGYVRNEPDGSVELVAEGAESEIRALLDDIQDRMSGRIRHMREGWSGATGQYDRFEVRY